MHVFLQLLSLYQKRGFHVRVGLQPHHFQGLHPLVLPFAALFQGDEQYATGLGMSPFEITVMDTLCTHRKPKSIFIIGNAFGWSTLALALSNPSAKIVAIDALTEGEHARLGFDLTKRIAQEEGFDIHVVEGFSPRDVGPIAEEYLSEKVDFALIDGLHTNSQQQLDFDAVRTIASTDCVYLLHDVINHRMQRSFFSIKAKNKNLHAEILTRTTSGMGIVYPTDDPILEQIVRGCTEDKKHVMGYADIVLRLNRQR